MIKDLTIKDYEAVKNIISELHKMHVENRPDFYLKMNARLLSRNTNRC